MENSEGTRRGLGGNQPALQTGTKTIKQKPLSGLDRNRKPGAYMRKGANKVTKHK